MDNHPNIRKKTPEAIPAPNVCWEMKRIQYKANIIARIPKNIPIKKKSTAFIAVSLLSVDFRFLVYDHFIGANKMV
jgi:hypothetical protein